MHHDETSTRIKKCEERLERMEQQLNGNGDGNFGISQKVSIMWRAGIGALYSISAGAGIMATSWLQHIIAKVFK